MDIDALLDAAVPQQATVPVCTRGDLLDEYHRATAALEAARERAGDSLSGNPDVPELAARVEQLRQQVEATTISVVLRAMPQPEWAPLLAAHPPRDDVPTDKVVGYNPTTYFPALVRRSIHSPDMADDTRWDRFVRIVSDAQWDQLADRAWKLNQKTVDVPFWPTASTSPGNSVPA